MIKAYIAVWNQLTASGTVKPKTHIMDNKASEEYKKEIQKNCTIQLVPPDNHRQNLAEQAIQTFKNHFKAILVGVDETFPRQFWDRLLPQTILTLNFLQQSNTVPTVSAHQYVHGNFNYNKLPLAPMGCTVQLHESSERKGTWSDNSIDGWYLQASPEHYQCYVIYVKQTNSKKVSDTVYFKMKYITQPTLTPADIIIKVLNNLTQALQGKTNLKGLEQIKPLRKLDDILNNSPTTISKPPESPPQENRQVAFDQAT
jgi:hypothetical protein